MVHRGRERGSPGVVECFIGVLVVLIGKGGSVIEGVSISPVGSLAFLAFVFYHHSPQSAAFSA